jgi:hypothetical protein
MPRGWRIRTGYSNGGFVGPAKEGGEAEMLEILLSKGGGFVSRKLKFGNGLANLPTLWREYKNIGC